MCSFLKIHQGTVAGGEWGAGMLPSRTHPGLQHASCQDPGQDLRKGKRTSAGVLRSSKCSICCLGFAAPANPCVLLTKANLDYNEGLY